MLKEILISDGLIKHRDIIRLMKTAFPRNEQVPYLLLRLLTLHKDVHLRTFAEESQLCGIVYTIEDDKYIFVLYLAVVDQFRAKGYGSQILQWLKANTTKVIVLNVESTETSAPNALQREKRIAFYKRNGITDTNHTFAEGGERYTVLSSDCTRFNAREYEKLMKRFSLGLCRRKIYDINDKV